MSKEKRASRGLQWVYRQTLQDRGAKHSWYPHRPHHFVVYTRTEPPTHQFDTPSEHRGLEVLLIREEGPFEDLHRVHHTEPSVELSPGRVVIQVLSTVSSTSSSSLRSPRLNIQAGTDALCTPLTFLYHSTASLGIDSAWRYPVNSSTMTGNTSSNRFLLAALSLDGWGAAGAAGGAASPFCLFSPIDVDMM